MKQSFSCSDLLALIPDTLLEDMEKETFVQVQVYNPNFLARTGLQPRLFKTLKTNRYRGVL
jgi:hypothetical protein